MKPEHYLFAARRFLELEPFTEAQRRSAALMARTGVEKALDDYWDRTRYELRRCSRKIQLLCLATMAGTSEGQAGDVAWRTLSDLRHYRLYQITPLASEVNNALALAERAMAALSNAT